MGWMMVCSLLYGYCVVLRIRYVLLARCLALSYRKNFCMRIRRVQVQLIVSCQACPAMYSYYAVEFLNNHNWQVLHGS